ncbi:MAG: hypothetical protein ABI175_01870, partial [Polyangiales bacterium]
ILDYLHTRSPPVIHRDIKPSNLVRAVNGRLALVDFGGVLDAARESGGSTMVGTFGYMAPEQLHGQVTPATDLYALGATIVSLAGGIEPEDVPRKGLRMDLAKHLPALDPALRSVLIEMTDPDPDKRPQRARDVVALLAKAKPPPELGPTGARSTALDRSPNTQLAPRLMFSDIPEPMGTLLRLGVLGFGFAGWGTMWGIRISVTIAITVLAVLAFPVKSARASIRGVGKELDAMLTEGQGGFSDLMRGAMARRR